MANQKTFFLGRIYPKGVRGHFPRKFSRGGGGGGGGERGGGRFSVVTQFGGHCAVTKYMVGQHV